MWIVLFLAGLAGCRAEAPPQTPATATRIVSLAPNLTEILFALGLGDRVVAVTQDSNWPPEAAKRPHVGTFWQPNIEAVVGARPDLVVTLAFGQQRELAERLRGIGCRCLTVKIDHVAELYAAIEQIGATTGTAGRAAVLIDRMRADLATIEKDAGSARPKVLWVVQRQPLRVAGTETFADEMIRLAGGQNAMGSTIQKYPPIGIEQVVASAPDVILEPSMGGADLASAREQARQYWSALPSVPAVRDGRVYIIDGDKASRLGPRLPEGVRLVAEVIRDAGAGP
ncbi:MAG TPA: hypothetical protein ENN87_12685 [Phycisphaerales bacterium]|nr:hypothetical protein [Phycisphaerales bacterium]